METQDLPPLKFDRKRSRVKTCPCGKSNRDGKFVPYVDYDDKGYCHACDKTFKPEVEQDIKPYVPKPEPPTSYFQFDTFKSSLTGYDTNVLVMFLNETFGTERTSQVVGKYFIGSTKKGAAVFWQIDTSGKIRSGKLIQYDSTGHRIKGINPRWAHTELNLEPYNLKQCLFGAHLLKGNHKPAAVVESEKTACIASLYFPEYVWLACGGIHELSADKMQALKGRSVLLFPDVQGFEQWTKRAQELAPMLDIKVSDLLERRATPEERNGKLDIADYLLRYKIEDFVKGVTQPATPSFETLPDGSQIEMHSAGYPLSWNVPMTSLTEKLIYRLGCEIHNHNSPAIPWHELANKPKSMPMLSIEQYRANGWKSN